MRVRPGQKLVLKNWSTAKEQECRVVHVREKPIGKNEVGVAFPFAMPKFWNIDFPPAGLDAVLVLTDRSSSKF